ncbi:MAG: hypothetical protein NTX46_00305 [Chloroflexi bacterium]|nr:hypothetical protein [Chloroflexota bacterium]
MEEDKVLIELNNLRKEIQQLKNNLSKRQRENSLFSLSFFIEAFGISITLYSSGILNQAISFNPPIWFGYMGVVVGIFIMLTPIITSRSKSKKGNL